MTDTRKPESHSMTPSVVNSTTFAFDSTADMVHATASRKGYLYSRWANPTVVALEERVAQLEGGTRTVAVSSGQAANTLALMVGALAGGTLVIAADVYGGTHQLAEELLSPLGVKILRPTIGQALLEAAHKLGKGDQIHVEMPTNPLIRMVDLPALRKAAPAATISVDATFASPVLFKPLAHGADLSVHSATKYMGGHHDVLCGVISGNDEDLMERVWNLRKLLGPTLGPQAAYRMWRSLETLELRVKQQCATTEALAIRLDAHPQIVAVHHPCLPHHPDHALAKSLMPHAGAVVSFELPNGDAAARVADRLKHIANAPSLGGTQSTMSWPAGVSHYALSPQERAQTWLSGGLLRLAVGIEDEALIWDDLAQALQPEG